jgi:microcystin-dependent protein
VPEPAPNPDIDGLVGAITIYAGETLPGPKYRWCHGTQTLSRTEFSLCFSRLGESWGSGDGSTTFTLPNLDKRFLVGVDGTGADVDDDEVGDTGGSASGSVSGSTSSDGAHSHGVNWGVKAVEDGVTGAVIDSPLSTDTDGSHFHTFSGSAATIPPYAAVRYIIKVA